jgi:hypothetical protein
MVAEQDRYLRTMTTVGSGPCAAIIRLATHLQEVTVTTQKPTDRSDSFEMSDKQLDMVWGGSQSSGAGAGKGTFNPFPITRKIDKASPIFFQN